MNYVINKKSWHYKLNDFMSNYNLSWRAPKDFCSYWRRTILSLIVLTIFFGGLTIFFGFMTFGILSFIYTQPLDALKILLSLVSLFSLAIGLGYLIDRYTNSNLNKEKKQPTTLIGMKYRSFKEKYCPIVEYKD